MNPFLPSIWNVLHDGGIERIKGNIPGDVDVFVSIEYLRERFPDEGDELVITLAGCTHFTWRRYEDEISTSDLVKIGDASMTILSAEMDEDTCRVFGDSGVLEVRCDGGSIRLDSGRTVSLEELLDVAEAYWKEWQKNGK